MSFCHFQVVLSDHYSRECHTACVTNMLQFDTQLVFRYLEKKTLPVFSCVVAKPYHDSEQVLLLLLSASALHTCQRTDKKSCQVPAGHLHAPSPCRAAHRHRVCKFKMPLCPIMKLQLTALTYSPPPPIVQLGSRAAQPLGTSLGHEVRLT